MSLALLLLAPSLLASLVHLEPASLDEVLAQATVILVVHPAEPALEERTEGEGDDACFFRVERHVVDQIVVAGDAILEVGATLSIAPSDVNISCAMQQTMAAGMPVPSPILPGYKPERREQPEGSRIVYLRPGPYDDLAYAVFDAWDPMDELEALKAKLTKAPPAD